MLKKVHLSEPFLVIAGSTIALYRIGTYIIIYFWGNTVWWHGVYTDQWNHYQIGAFLIIITLMFRKLIRARLKLVLTAVGTGMVIDEITDVIKLFHLYPLPPTFRDSIGDLFLIIVTFCIFSFLYLFFQKLHDTR